MIGLAADWLWRAQLERRQYAAGIDTTNVGVRKCGKCDGNGTIDENPCEDCDGTGWLSPELPEREFSRAWWSRYCVCVLNVWRALTDERGLDDGVRRVFGPSIRFADLHPWHIQAAELLEQLRAKHEADHQHKEAADRTNRSHSTAAEETCP